MKKFTINANKSITLFISGDFPEGNSKNARIKSIAKFYLKHKYKVLIVSVYPSRFSLAENNPKAGQWEGIEYRSLSRSKASQSKFGRFIQVIFGQLGLVLYILTQNRSIKNAYFYCPRFTDLLIPMFVCRLMNKNIIVDQTELFSARRKWPHALEERLIRNWANSIWCISSKLTDYFKTYQSKAKVQHLPIFVDLERFNKTETNSRFAIGYLGSFDQKDNIEVLINGFALVLKNFPELKFNLFGYSPRLEYYSNYISHLGLNSSVKLFGAVTYNEIPSLLMRCDTLVIARTSDPFASYGYPYKLGEYFASKVPVLSSEIDGFSSEFTDGVEMLKFEENNPISFAQDIRKRYTEVDLAESMVSNAFHYAKTKFSIDSYSALLLTSTS